MPATTKSMSSGVTPMALIPKTQTDPIVMAKQLTILFAATVRAVVNPRILWLWIGGLVMAIGTVLAAFPGARRRRPVDPVSAPIAVDTAAATGDDEPEAEPVGAPA